MDAVEFGKKLTQLREMHKISQDRMADYLQLSPYKYRKVESGEMALPSNSLQILATLTNISATTWLSGKPLPTYVLLNTPAEQKTVPVAADGADDQQLRWRRWLQRQIDSKTGGNQSDFARIMEKDNGLISKYLSGGKPLSERFLYDVSRLTGDYSWEEIPADEYEHEGRRLKRWLMARGIEQQQLAEMMGVKSPTLNAQLNARKIQQRSWDRILEVLGTTYHQIMAGYNNTPYNKTPDMRYVPDTIAEQPRETYGSITGKTRSAYQDTVSILKIPLLARASFGYYAYLQRAEAEKEYYRVPNDKLYPGVAREKHVIVEIDGDSMEPVLQHGYEMLAYQLDMERITKVLGRIVMIDYRDELPVKRLSGIDTVRGAITLKADNGGAEMTVPLSEIRSIWHIYEYYTTRFAL